MSEKALNINWMDAGCLPAHPRRLTAAEARVKSRQMIQALHARWERALKVTTLVLLVAFLVVWVTIIAMSSG